MKCGRDVTASRVQSEPYDKRREIRVNGRAERGEGSERGSEGGREGGRGGGNSYPSKAPFPSTAAAAREGSVDRAFAAIPPPAWAGLLASCFVPCARTVA